MNRDIHGVTKFLQHSRWRDFRVGVWRCPCCQWPIQLRLEAADYGVRCSRCRASAITQSLVDVLRCHAGDPINMDCLELSGRGALARWLMHHSGSLVLTEYLPDEPPGSVVDGVRNENVQAMTFASAQFDLCTCTEVFEHVQDDMAGFREVHRVLRPGGAFVFTVPLTGAERTVERARAEDGHVRHLLEPEYHADPYSGSDRVLCFRSYGKDITARLRQAGFAAAEIVRPRSRMFGYARGVVMASA